jgi:hypothetical protein
MMKHGAGWMLLLGLVAGCGGPEESAQGEAPTAAEAPDTEGRVTALNTVPVSVSEGSTWPKTVTWCGVGGHETHTAYQWNVSWSGSNVTTSTNCVSYSASGEACNLRARVAADNGGHTSLDTYRTVWDYRAFTVSPSSHSLVAGQSASLVAPAPHGNRHCDGTGRFAWEVLSGGVWTEVASSVNVTPWNVSSPTAGTETYRLKCTHGGNTHYGNQVSVTWSASPPPLSAWINNCSYTSSTSITCEGAASGGTQPYVPSWKQDTGSWVQGTMTRTFVCKSACRIYFQVKDATNTVADGLWAYCSAGSCAIP